MSRAWVIARVDLGRLIRDRTLLFFTLVMPVVVTVVIGTSFGGEPATFALGVADEDGGPLARRLVAALEDVPGAEVEHYDTGAQVRADLRREEIDAGIVVPDGFDARLDRGASASVTLVADPTDEAPVVRAAVAGAVADQGTRLVAARFASEHAGVTEAEAADIAREVAAGHEPVGVATVDVEGSEQRVEGRFDYTAPANLVLFVFINTLAVGTAIVEGRRLGVTRRVLSTPTAVRHVVAGAGISRLVFALAQAGVLLGLGALLFGVDWGDPAGAVVVTAVFGVVATATGLLVGSVAGNAQQAQAVGVPVAIALGMLGGCMWPLFIVPDAMRIAGHVTPHAWAMDAWIELVLDGGGLADVAVEVAVLAGFAVVLSAAAVAALARSVRNAPST